MCYKAKITDDLADDAQKKNIKKLLSFKTQPTTEQMFCILKKFVLIFDSLLVY